MNLTSTSPGPRLLDPLLANHAVCQIIVDAVCDGEVDALNDESPFRGSTHRGTRASQQAHHHLGERLSELGWLFAEETNQLRHVAPAGAFPRDVRLVLLRGNKQEGYIDTAQKGLRTFELVEENNEVIAAQGSFGFMPKIDTSTHWLNVFVVVELRGELAIRIHLVVPDDTSSKNGRTQLLPFEEAILFDGSLETDIVVEDLDDEVHINIEEL